MASKSGILVIVLLACCSGSSVAQQMDVTVYVEGGNNVYDGSPAKLICQYNGSNLAYGDQVLTIGWAIGDVLNSLTSIAYYVHVYGRAIDYPHDDFQEPRYTMTYVYGEDVNGSSELTIQSVDMHDTRLYWCTAATSNGVYDSKNTQVTVIDAPREVAATINVDQGNIVFLGSRATITCRYTKPPRGTLARLGFTHGSDNVNNRVRIADYYEFSTEPNPRYYSPFLPPEYIMTIDDIDQGTYGVSQLVINSITREDERRYWCDVNILMFPAAVYADTNLTVIDVMPPNTTTSTSHYPVTSSTQSTTFEYTTSDIIAYVEVIRVESHLIEIGWESFDMDVIDDVDEYRVFYSASLSESQNYNNAIFFDGAITGVNITSLIPNTMYNIRIEASTTEGSLINVGNIQVTTSTKMETDGFPFAIVASITAAVIVAVIVGVVVVCCMRSRRSVKAPPADASTIEPVYDVADDKEVYEDLQPVTLQEKHVYQRRIEPTDVSSGEHGIEYEVTPSGAKYEIPKIGPEYLELYNTAPTAENAGLMNNSEYMSLDKYTMDKDNVNTKYESLEVQSEYLELYNTVPVDNHDI